MKPLRKHYVPPKEKVDLEGNIGLGLLIGIMIGKVIAIGLLIIVLF